MVRWGVLAAGAAVVAGAAFVAGKSIPPRPVAGPVRPEAKGLGVLGQKTGYFNMARVMRENRRGKVALDALNARRARVAANLTGLKAMHDELKAALEAERNKAVVARSRDREYQMERDLLKLARQIEDTTRGSAAALNEQTGEIIVAVCRELRATTAEMARDHGLAVVLAYPAPVTPQEAENPALMELMLKPPAAHPFYLDPSVDYTEELLERLNAKFAADNGGN
jgi:Skp family chaperone for outer membrane proteins